jgi:hypothetical protein
LLCAASDRLCRERFPSEEHPEDPLHRLTLYIFRCRGNRTAITAPEPQTASICGTDLDVNNGIVPGATVVLESSIPGDRRRAAADDSGFLVLGNLKPDISCRVTIDTDGFDSWTSPPSTLNPSQNFLLTTAMLKIAGGLASVTVVAFPAEISAEQVHFEEHQHVLGFIPNFLVAMIPTQPRSPQG